MEWIHFAADNKDKTASNYDILNVDVLIIISFVRISNAMDIALPFAFKNALDSCLDWHL